MSNPPSALSAALPLRISLPRESFSTVSKLEAAPSSRSDVAFFIAAYPSNPAFDMDLFAGAIHLAIIEDIPAKRIYGFASEPSRRARSTSNCSPEESRHRFPLRATRIFCPAGAVAGSAMCASPSARVTPLASCRKPAGCAAAIVI